ERCTPHERKLVETVLEERAFITVQHQQVLDMLHRYGSIQYAHDAAAEQAETARRALDSFPDSEIKRALLAIPEFVVERNS
ncbi:MAG TPA: polyprenyl synthetase family protein, partial [Alphaproteobacteria bacterium]|nr:polyprenyl synthetase family protein [Alphaproteobacteria bacterium]